MPTSAHSRPVADLHIRPAIPADVGALLALERKVFTTDRVSRRSFRRLLCVPTAQILVAEVGHRIAGYALVLYREGSRLARLYSIAADPHHAPRGTGAHLLA